MKSVERRARLLALLRGSERPLSGEALGEALGVSRQVIVQDVALLRAEGAEILSTARGLRAPLSVRSRSQAAAFCEEIRSGRSSLLKNVTSGVHRHTVRAETEQELDEIERALSARGFLIHDTKNSP